MSLMMQQRGFCLPLACPNYLLGSCQLYLQKVTVSKDQPTVCWTRQSMNETKLKARTKQERWHTSRITYRTKWLLALLKFVHQTMASFVQNSVWLWLPNHVIQEEATSNSHIRHWWIMQQSLLPSSAQLCPQAFFFQFQRWKAYTNSSSPWETEQEEKRLIMLRKHE